MKELFINEILQESFDKLDSYQRKKLKTILENKLLDYDLTVNKDNKEEENIDILDKFISAKRIEGCSDKSLNYYKKTIEYILAGINKNVIKINTEDLRSYLISYQNIHQSSKVTIDNIS